MIRRGFLLLFLPAVLCLGEQTSSVADAKAAFAKADRALNEAWTAIKKTLPEKVFAELKAKQREWIASRDRRALEASPNPNDEVEAKRSATYSQTAATLTEERAQWLRQLANKEDDTLTGFWTDGNAGNLEIVDRKERLLFVFHVVRSRSFHAGVLAGSQPGIPGSGGSATKGGSRTKRMRQHFVHRT